MRETIEFTHSKLSLKILKTPNLPKTSKHTGLGERVMSFCQLSFHFV